MHILCASFLLYPNRKNITKKYCFYGLPEVLLLPVPPHLGLLVLGLDQLDVQVLRSNQSIIQSINSSIQLSWNHNCVDLTKSQVYSTGIKGRHTQKCVLSSKLLKRKLPPPLIMVWPLIFLWVCCLFYSSDMYFF